VRGGATFAAARDRHLAGLAERDRRLAHELAAGVLRRRAQLDCSLPLATTDPRLHDILRLGAYQLRALDRVPVYAAVSTSVALAREIAGEAAAGFVNQALRKLAQIREVGSGKGEGAATHPRWLLMRWRRQFGAAETERLVTWNDTKPSITLQPARWDQNTLLLRLRDAGIGVEEAPFGAGIRVGTGTHPSPFPLPRHLPGFGEGGFIVQDPAHALVCRYAAVPRGALVYDACAAPGGKGVTLERLGARVVAGDARRDRLARLADTVRRAAVAIPVVGADLVAAPLAPATADAVLVDAPCSATGTMARHPDARWRLSPRLIGRASARQRELLHAAAPLVRPGGLLIYATCSLEPEENGDVVNAFLQRHREFARAPEHGAVAAELLTADGDFQSLPQRHAVDGAFAARLRRVH